MESPPTPQEAIRQKDIKLEIIAFHTIRFALSQNPFFYFLNISSYFPHLTSLSEFIEDKGYLAGLEITFLGTKERLDSITSSDNLRALNGLLQSIEQEIKDNSTEYEGSSFIHDYIQNIFIDKEIKVLRDTSQARGQSHEEIVGNADWYAYNCNYGTMEEKKFVELFSRRFDELNQKFKSIYLIRNERELKIYDKKGRAFEPDFLLFCKEKEDNEYHYQVFIEPKGAFLVGYDKWKENFLQEIQAEGKTIKIETDSYLITAVPFYNYENENEFMKNFRGIFSPYSSN